MKEITNKTKGQRCYELDSPNAQGEQAIYLRPKESRTITEEEFQSRRIQKAVANGELRVRNV